MCIASALSLLPCYLLREQRDDHARQMGRRRHKWITRIASAPPLLLCYLLREHMDEWAATATSSSSCHLHTPAGPGLNGAITPGSNRSHASPRRCSATSCTR
ncbi:hypothetical protein ZWY2020_000020 [Hordeum vulgare]|nr:hypothetical protein ZWY2020_000020 [Hordeum vulgare]